MTVLQIEDDGGARLLTLNRPEAKNAFNEKLWNATSDALEAALDDDDIGCVVITGAPGAFSAGADLAEMADPPEIPEGAQRGFYRFMDVIEAFDKPLVAAVNGVAVGIGLTLLPHCDLVFIARSARLRAPFVNLGVTTEAGSSASLAATMGWHDAAYAIFTAGWIDAETALRSGLAWRLSDDDQVVGDAMEVAREIGAMPVNALRTTKRLMIESRGGWREARRREDEVFPSLIGSDENIAALTAFLGG
jgi:enoyl-CoA hydratase/carnithine racemase